MMITARTIPEAHFLVCRYIKEHGYCYTIQRGSYCGSQRKQIPYLAIIVTHPYTMPLASVINGTQVSTDESITTYFVDYLVSSQISANEQYTYGQRLSPWYTTIANMLIETPFTNQATIEVARSNDIELEDPPCLRLLSWKMTPDGLQLSSFWRSWDAYGALPVNLGGLQHLNIMMSNWTGHRIGPLVAYSDGAHLYRHSLELV